MSRFGIIFRGCLMGAADLVPGVSGGTIALVSGIYYRLIEAIRCCDFVAVRFIFLGEFRKFWSHIDGEFLLLLVAGIFLSIFSLAGLIEILLSDYPLIVWSAFFGLILASAVLLAYKVGKFTPFRIFLVTIGLIVSGAISLMPGVALDGGAEIIFFSGFIAIIAMILPGISGSFILVLLGMYPSLLRAISSLDLFFLSLFFTGAVTGLILFSRILSALLKRANEATMSLLSGFLIGSLPVVWPWKKIASTYLDKYGESVPSQWLPITPGEYSEIHGLSAQLELSIFMMIFGFIFVCGLEIFSLKTWIKR